MNKNLILTDERYGKKHLWALADRGQVTGSIFDVRNLEKCESEQMLFDKVINKWAEYEKIAVIQVSAFILDCVKKLVLTARDDKPDDVFVEVIAECDKYHSSLVADNVGLLVVAFTHKVDGWPDNTDNTDEEGNALRTTANEKTFGALADKTHIYLTPDEIHQLEIATSKQNVEFILARLSNIAVDEKTITLENLQEMTGCKPEESDVTLVKA